MSDQLNLNEYLLGDDLPEIGGKLTESLKQNLNLSPHRNPSERQTSDELAPSSASETATHERNPRDLLEFQDATLESESLGLKTLLPSSKDIRESSDAIHAALSPALTSLNTSSAHLSPPATSVIPTLVQLTDDLCFELRQNLAALLQLNPGRRKSLLNHLQLLGGSSGGSNDSPKQGSHRTSGYSHSTPGHTGTGSTPQMADAKEELRKWIVGPRSAQQDKALRVFLDEVAITCVAQALLLKAWSDRGICPFEEKDLCQLNWALSQALKPFVPLNREGWQITRPNLYSWFNPTEALRNKIWRTLSQFDLRFEGSHLIESLLRFRKSSEHSMPRTQSSFVGRSSYDSRFLSSVFGLLGHFGLDAAETIGQSRGFSETPPPKAASKHAASHGWTGAETAKPAKFAFSPTLRDGTMIRTAPKCFQWIGMESYPFDMLISELTQLWNGPSVPPLWAEGNGLDAHGLDQLPLKWNNPRPSALAFIRDIESCELAVVLEEVTVKTHGRSLEARALHQQLDSLPYYQNIRAPETSLGALQACVALTKLRPGGLLFWARSEPLSSKDGHKFLKFMLDRGVLVTEWDLSQVEHSLPHAGFLFPKYLYLIKREPNLDVRNSHRPKRIQTSGTIRSHVEVSELLKDTLTGNAQSARTQWRIHAQQSPVPQNEWIDHWPDPTTQESVLQIEHLRENSMPLGQFALIRRISPDKDPVELRTPLAGAKPGAPQPPSVNALSLSVVSYHGKCHLEATPCQSKPRSNKKEFLVILPEARFVAPVAHFLESDLTSSWLDHFSEKKNLAWLLSEQTLKFAPIPKPLIQQLKEPTQPSHPNLRALLADIPYNPKKVLTSLGELFKNLGQLETPDEVNTLKAQFYIRAAQAHFDLEVEQHRLFSLVEQDSRKLREGDGSASQNMPRIRWKEFLQILPSSECTPFTQHPEIRLNGSLPPHLPIHHIARIKANAGGLMFATENGLSIKVNSDNRQIVEMLADQLNEFKYPTWNELTQAVFLPKDLELAHATAADVLRCYHEQMVKRSDLVELLNACLPCRHPSV